MDYIGVINHIGFAKYFLMIEYYHQMTIGIGKGKLHITKMYETLYTH